MADSDSSTPRTTALRIGVVGESYEGERRLAMTPAAVEKLRKRGFELIIEPGAGVLAGFTDAAYEAAGAVVSPEAWRADIVLKLRPPTPGEVARLRRGALLIGFLQPALAPGLLSELAERGIDAIAVDAIPRISRAQKLDALSSMANVAGYRAVVEAAHHFGRFFAGQITAAGRVEPAKVLVIGAGVAGLAAIGAARGLGAIVRAFDTRPAVAEQIESMGAEFLKLDFEEDGDGGGGYAKVMSPEFIAAELELFMAQCREVDVVITTALIPGVKAPLLLERRHVEAMRPGSVIVDLAAEQGGNCELTEPGQVVVHAGVTIVGATDLPSRMAAQSSQLYATNLVNLLEEIVEDGALALNLDDEIVSGSLVVYRGESRWPTPRPEPSPPAKRAPSAAGPSPAPQPRPGPSKPGGHGGAHGAAPPASDAQTWTWLLVVGLALLGIGLFAPMSFLTHLTVFVLAVFVGWQVIWNVTPALHTPLMSVTNAISGIIIIGGIIQVSSGLGSAATWLGAAAVFFAAINIAGGFLVTQRMLQMFRK